MMHSFYACVGGLREEMKPLSLVVVSFLAAVILLLPVCRTQEPPYTVQTIESSLKHMKNVWESLYTNFLNNNDSVACSDALENLPGCLEIELDGEGRTFLASAEGERAYLENIVSFLLKYFFISLLI